MGACLSLVSVLKDSQPTPPTSKVVSIHGTLREYSVPVSVSLVLQAEASSSSSNYFFLCNSDFLSYDDYIPALDSNAQLYADQLYFVLPRSKLQNRLSASDMAALAVKASVAFQNSSNKDGRRHKKARISPVFTINQSPSHPLIPINDGGVIKSFEKLKQDQRSQQQSPVGFSRSGSVKRLQKYASRRAKFAVRSFRLRLSTIYEGTVL